MIGMILGNRYEILKEIGSGGMANVYLAHCRLLNRNVAVKVLKTEFANDKEFLERFNKEAQAAAAISSPNIVNAFDVGHDGDIHYIVMEYVEGQTLKKYIDENGMLSWQETVEYAIQICTALDKAHRNGIVHRDIKPQNIILTNDGVLKVTDFGIARASSNETMNMGESTMGSVHYFSPEQARGGYTDEKSDIYSLGIVMYELVTGILPFNGETPIAIAIKHMQQKPVSPKEFNISIPLAVEAIILKAMSKEQHLRYQTAAEMLSDLNKVINSPGVLPDDGNHSGNTIKIEPVDEIPEVKTEEEPPVQVYRRPGGDSKVRKERPVKKSKAEGGSVKKAIFMAIISAFAVFGLMAVIVFGMFSGCSKEVEIPDILGMEYEKAVERYGDKFTITIERNIESDKYPPGYIIEQDPEGGRITKSKKEIKVALSKDVEGFVMGDFEDSNLEFLKGNLQQEINEYNITLEIIEESHPEIEKGKVIKTIPGKNANVRKGSKITVYVSLGNAIQVPDLEGLKLGEAKELLLENKIEIGTVTPKDATDDKVVEWQSIEAYEEVEEGTKVNLRVDDGMSQDNSNDEGGNSGNDISNSSSNLPTSDTGL